MKIGINLLYLIPGVVGGTETYAVSLIRALAAIDRENEYCVYLNREAAGLALPAAANIRRVVCPLSAALRPMRYAWEQCVLPWQLWFGRLDVVHSLGYVGPLLAPCPSVVTVCDLNFMLLKEIIPERKRLWLAWFSVNAARRAARVITISEFSKTQIQEHLNLASRQITVTPLGPGWESAPLPAGKWQALRQAYGLPADYVAAIGGNSPHKNMPRLIAAFGRAGRDLPHRLILIGRLPPELDLAAEAARAGVSGRVMALGYVPREHLAPLFAHAGLFVFPSLYEGFGLPVLEAQQAGAPVACATSASLPEVAGDGAVFFDPLSVDQMADAIRQCLLNPELCSDLRRRGYANARRFSWERTARATLAVYAAVAGGS